MEIYTIGHSKKLASEFFGILNKHGVRRLIDIRLRNNTVFVTYTKRDDLRYFLSEICNATYLHNTSLAPTKDLLDGYKNESISWEDYERDFRALLEHRAVEEELNPKDFEEPTVLLCSEPEADHCHRRLVAEYLRDCWEDEVVITHL